MSAAKTPRLELANTGRPFTVRCVGCRYLFGAGNTTHGVAVYADLNGLPFTDYYCALCAEKVRAEQRNLKNEVKP